MPSGKRLWIAVVMLLWFWSPSDIAMDPLRLQERTGKPSARSAVTQEGTDTLKSPRRACRPRAASAAGQRVHAPPLSVVNYNGLKRVTCPAPEDDQPIVSAGVAMASP